MFDEILADCLEALAKGATIRDCLTRYPAEATALEPLLRLAVALSREGETRLSSGAFGHGRQQLVAAARARQAQSKQKTAIHHRQPRYTPLATPQRQMPLPAYQQPYAQNGRPLPRQARNARPMHWQLRVPRLLSLALVLLALVSATTFFRQVATSLPGTWLYLVKNSSERMVAVLMTAAGEEVAWQESQLERRLHELTQLTDANGTMVSATVVQSTTQAVESNWQALLTATEGLAANERTALLQAQIARFQQLETMWADRQEGASQTAVITLRRLIASGAAALATLTPLEEATAVAVTATAITPISPPISTPIPASTMMPMASATVTPTVTPTSLLQPSATVPVLEPSPTATLISVPATVVPVGPSPTLPPTPLPEITVQIPRQESGEQERDEHKPGEGASGADAPLATLTPLTVETIQTDVETVTPAIGPGPEEGMPAPTLVSTEAATPTAADQTPTVTSGEGAWPLSTRVVVPATATPEPVATNTTRPTNQPNATKTPKATATQDHPEPATPNAPTAAPVVTSASSTPMERTPNATTQPPVAQPPIATKEVTPETPVSASPTPRATVSSGEATKTPQP